MPFGKKLTDLPEKTTPVVDADLLLLTDSDDGLSKKVTGDKLPEDPSAKWLDPVRVRTTANVDLAGGGLAAGQTVDGIVLVAGDRVLAMVQDDATEVGIYVAPASGAASRASDLPVGAFASLVCVLVDEGTAHEDTAWICTTNKGVDEVGTDQLNFGPFPASASAHASTHISGGGDPIAGCDLACGQTPSHFTPTSATIGGMVEGIDGKLGELGAQSVTADADGVLDHSSSDEVAYLIEAEVDKAAGNWTGVKVNITETAAPGTDDRLLDLQTGGTTRFRVANNGSATIANAGTDAAPGLRIDRGSGGAVGITNPADSQLGLVANNEKLLVDNDGGVPSLRPDATETWALGELAFAYAQVYSAQLSLVSGGVLAAALTPTQLLVSKTTASFAITAEDADPGDAGVPLTFRAGKAGDADGATAPTGAAWTAKAGDGGDGDASENAGHGGAVRIEGGDAGVAGAGGGGSGGNVDIRGGVGTGAFLHGGVQIGTAETEQVDVGMSGKLTWIHGKARIVEELHLQGRIRYDLAPKTETGTTRSTAGDGSGSDDDGYTVIYTSTSAKTLTVDQAYAGCRSKHVPIGAGALTAVAGSGVTLVYDSTTFSAPATAAPGAALYLEWLDATTVLVEGGLTV